MRANSRLLEQLQELGQEKEQLIQELQEARKVGNTEGVAQTAGAQVMWVNPRECEGAESSQFYEEG